jgi:(p)ppGpp synthase/HD superfamily hydrolase
VIDLAIEVAAKAHQDQFRKGTDIPYITHPLAVGIILAKSGCSDEVIAAGILHDTLEDTKLTLEEIIDKFGDTVAGIVEGASEPDKSLPWEERKQHTIDFVKEAPQDVKFVVLADKLHNIKSIAADYRRIGEKVWERFNEVKGKQEWYYQGLVRAMHDISAGKATKPSTGSSKRRLRRFSEARADGGVGLETRSDRAALGTAIKLNIQRGGWIPKGRKGQRTKEDLNVC